MRHHCLLPVIGAGSTPSGVIGVMGQLEPSRGFMLEDAAGNTGDFAILATRAESHHVSFTGNNEDNLNFVKQCFAD